MYLIILETVKNIRQVETISIVTNNNNLKTHTQRTLLLLLLDHSKVTYLEKCNIKFTERGKCLFLHNQVSRDLQMCTSILKTLDQNISFQTSWHVEGLNWT